MRRRAILTLACTSATWVRRPALAQARNVKRIGYLTALGPDHPSRMQAEREFAEGMRRLGWEVGRTCRGARIPPRFRSRNQTEYEVVINQAIARATAIDIPYAVLVQATEVLD